MGKREGKEGRGKQGGKKRGGVSVEFIRHYSVLGCSSMFAHFILNVDLRSSYFYLC